MIAAELKMALGRHAALFFIWLTTTRYPMMWASNARPDHTMPSRRPCLLRPSKRTCAIPPRHVRFVPILFS